MIMVHQQHFQLSRGETEYAETYTGAHLYESNVFVAPNGKIYAAPRGASKVLEIDPTGASATSQQLLETYTGADLYDTSTLAPNGKIYAAPLEAGKVLEIEPGLR